MKPLILLGEPETKRTEFFRKAAADMGEVLTIKDSRTFDPLSVPEAFIKIDPYAYGSASIKKMEEFTKTYAAILKRLSESRHMFLNEPEEILAVLDKLSCKERLEQFHIPVTRLVGSHVRNTEELRQLCCEKRLSGVFVKPRYGAGAAGVLAYRFYSARNREVLYTSSMVTDEDLVNTRKLRRIEEASGIEEIVDRVLKMDTIVEQWYPKAKAGGRTYDLRVVVQFGKIDYILARSSTGPITNLQLNNGALPFDELKLPEHVSEKVEQLSLRVMEAYPGLRSAGIDLLLTEDSYQPYVIEINGQGDLIYRDIYAENRIYKNQINFYKGIK